MSLNAAKCQGYCFYCFEGKTKRGMRGVNYLLSSTHTDTHTHTHTHTHMHMHMHLHTQVRVKKSRKASL